MTAFNIYPYVVVLRFSKADKHEEHTVRTEAYTLSEAIVQASFQLEATHDFTTKGYTAKCISVGPDTEKVRERMSQFVSDLTREVQGRKTP